MRLGSLILVVILVLGIVGCSALVEGLPDVNVNSGVNGSSAVDNPTENYNVPSDSSGSGSGANDIPPGGWGGGDDGALN